MWIGITINHHKGVHRPEDAICRGIFNTEDEAKRYLVKYYFEFGYFDYLYHAENIEKYIEAYPELVEHISGYQTIEDFQNDFKSVFLNKFLEIAYDELKHDVEIHVLESDLPE